MKSIAGFLILVATAYAQESEVQRAGERIRQAQYVAAVERRAQHREIERVQPVSHLTPAEEIARRKAEVDRLVAPAGIAGTDQGAERP